MNPLDQLRDIHSPPPPGWWPPAPGWWLLAALVLGAILLAGLWLWRRHRRRAYRRAARAELAALALRGEEYDIHALLTLVRRTARAGNVDSVWPALPAATLLARLDHGCDNRLRDALQAEGISLDELAAQQYRPQANNSLAEGAALHHCCAWWIDHHRKEDLN